MRYRGKPSVDRSEAASTRLTIWAADLRRWNPPPATPVSVPTSFAEVAAESAWGSAVSSAAIEAAMGVEGELVAPRLARGVRCYAACLADRVVAYGWRSAGAEWIGEVGLEIRPAPDEAYVWNCVTLPAFRRRGLFRSLLRFVTERARTEGRSRLWIGSLEGTAESAIADLGYVAVLKLVPESADRLRVVPAVSGSPTLVKAARRALGVGSLPVVQHGPARQH